MESEVRRLHRWSWPFIAMGTIRALIVPMAGAVFASGGDLLWRPGLLSGLFVLPALIYAFLRQRVYNYRFTDSELVVRNGLLTKNVRHIAYERIHNVALVRNPIHRMLGVTTARIETAAGGKPEALLRVVSLEAAKELMHYTLADGHKSASTDAVETTDDATPLLQVPDRELLRLGLISNRGLLVVAAALGAASQVRWWEQSWFRDQNWSGTYELFQGVVPGWLSRETGRPSLFGGVLVALAFLFLLLVLLRVLSMAWYLVRYRGFTLDQNEQELRSTYGMWSEVSSLIPAHRIQLVTVSAPLLHRLFRRASIDVETAGDSDTKSGFEGASGVASTRQWLAPIIEADRALGLVREVMPEVDLDQAEWNPIEAGATQRIVRRIAIAVTPITLGVAALFALTPIPLSAWHALWLPPIVLTLAWLVSRQWVRHTGYALTDQAILFRSGWIGRQISAVRFVNAQTFSMSQSPFDRRKRMASIAVDTAGAGSLGHRIQIPFLDVAVAEKILQRLYDETRSTEFRW